MVGKRRAVIAGIGRTEFSRKSGRTTLGLAAAACRAALDDAGMPASEVDGFGCYGVADTPRTVDTAYALGHDGTLFNLDLYGGGQQSPFLVAQGYAAVEAGLCDAILVYRAMNGRSGKRFATVEGDVHVPGAYQFSAPAGYMTPPQWFALWARVHMEKYGTTIEDLGHVAMTFRKHAEANPHAVQRSPMTMADYLAGRWVNDPFRIYDCALEVDGAVALLITTAERACDLRQIPVRVLGSRAYFGAGGTNDQWKDMTQMYSAFVAPKLWELSGVKPADVQVACIYDCFTYTALCTTEDFGFCQKGEGGRFYSSGRATYGGDTVVNPHGGLLSEGYLHGFNHHYEAILQLRHQAEKRQVADAKVALVSGGGPAYGSAIVYARGDQ